MNSVIFVFSSSGEGNGGGGGFCSMCSGDFDRRRSHRVQKHGNAAKSTI
jgi:hypothetical protein